MTRIIMQFVSRVHPCGRSNTRRFYKSFFVWNSFCLTELQKKKLCSTMHQFWSWLRRPCVIESVISIVCCDCDGWRCRKTLFVTCPSVERSLRNRSVSGLRIDEEVLNLTRGGIYSQIEVRRQFHRYLFRSCVKQRNKNPSIESYTNLALAI